jgi:glutamyl-tRNA reductase
MPARQACPHQDTCHASPGQIRFHTAAAFSGLAALRAISVNHHTTGFAELATLSLAAPDAQRLRERLAESSIEAAVLATCNRSEVYWRARLPGDDDVAAGAFCDALGLGEDALGRVSTRWAGEAAARHLFRVCCGLESLVVGEAEILGQVRAANEASVGAGDFIPGVLRAALRAGRQARAETAIGVGAMSVASMAVRWLAGRVALGASRVLVVGAGQTGTKTARLLRAEGAERLTIANRSFERATALADSVGARVISLEALDVALADADAVIVTAQASDWLITAEQLKRAVADRPGGPLLVIDLAMPAGVEPANVAGACRMDLTGLEAHVEQHRRSREAEIPRVEAVIARELGWLRGWARHEALRPLVSDLRRKVESIRRSELARALDEASGAAVHDADLLERLSRRLLDHVLAIPLATLEDENLPIGPTDADSIRRLFALDPGGPGCG